MDQDKTTKISEAIEWVLTKCTQLHRIELHDVTYVGRTSMFSHLFDAAVLNADEDYEDLMYYLEHYRTFHSLGKQFEFGPPVVNFASSGVYFQVIEVPTEKAIVSLFNEMLSDGDGRLRPRRCRDRVEEYVHFSTVVSNMMTYFSMDGQPETRQMFQELAKNAILAGTDWILDQYEGELSVPLTMKIGSTEWVDKMFSQGGPINESAVFSYLAKDVYATGVSYYFGRNDGKYSKEFLAHADDLAEKNGFDLVDGYYQEKPITMPDNIKEIGEAILSEKHDLQTGEYGYQIIPIVTVRERLASANIVMNKTQIENQLLGRGGDWREALINNGFKLEITRHSSRSFQDYDTNGEHIFDALAKIRQLSDGSDDNATVEFASGFPVAADGVILDNSMNRLIYLSMIGDRTAVRANWSQLMEYNRFLSFRMNSFKVGGAKHHRMFQTKLPSGLWQIMLVHNNAIPKLLDPLTDTAYIVALGDYSDKMPKGFTDYLNLLLHTPVLREWGKRLWMLGRITGLIDYASSPSGQIGGTAWKIRNSQDNWNDLISTNVAAKDLVF